MKNEFDIRQIVYTLINELRYSNKEEYLRKQIERVKLPNYNATMVDTDYMLFATTEKRLLYLQEEFERWIKEQKGE